MKQNEQLTELENLKPCADGLEYASKAKSLHAAWDNCERGDWMLWYLRKKNLLDKPTSVRLACIFAKNVLAIFEKKYPKDMRPRRAIEAALEYLESPSEETRLKARAAAAAAYAAAYADAYAAAAAAAAAAYAAYAAAADAYAAAADAYADAYADAAAAAAAAYARNNQRKFQADQIRLVVKNPFKKGTK